MIKDALWCLYYGIWEFRFIKYGLLSNRLFQTIQDHGGWKEPQGSDKLLQKTLSSSFHME